MAYGFGDRKTAVESSPSAQDRYRPRLCENALNTSNRFIAGPEEIIGPIVLHRRTEVCGASEIILIGMLAVDENDAQAGPKLLVIGAFNWRASWQITSTVVPLDVPPNNA